MHRPDKSEPEPRNPPSSRNNEPPKPPPPRTAQFACRFAPPPPGPRLVRKERCTYHIRFRRGWFGRLVVQVELAVKWYELLNQDKGPVKSAIEWRDASKHELEEIARGYFWPELHRDGAKN